MSSPEITRKSSSVCLVLPAYNKAQVVERCLHNLINEASAANINLCIILVDDASTDGTVEAASHVLHSSLKIVRLPENKGKGAAIKHGVSLAPSTSEFVGYFDADLDIHPRVLVDLLEAVRTNSEVSGALASKVHPDSSIQYPLIRRAGSLVFSLFARLLIDVRFRDTQTGAKLFRTDVIKDLASQCVIDGFAFDVELLARASRAGMNLAEAPVDLSIEFGSTVALSNIVDAFRDLWKVRSALQNVH